MPRYPGDEAPRHRGDGHAHPEAAFALVRQGDEFLKLALHLVDLLVHRLDTLPQNAILDRVDFGFHDRISEEGKEVTAITDARRCGKNPP